MSLVSMPTYLQHCANAGKCYRRQASLFKRSVLTIEQKKTYSIYEPDGLDYVPDIPEYETLNFKIQGYDFCTLESCAKYLHRLFTSLDYEVQSFAVPARTFDIQTLKPNTSNVLANYELSMYQRVIQVQNVPSTTGSLALQVVQQNLPEGVSLTVKEPDQEEEDERYIPDVVLNNLKEQMDAIFQAKEDKKKK